jgi:hypothetical protein
MARLRGFIRTRLPAAAVGMAIAMPTATQARAASPPQRCDRTEQYAEAQRLDAEAMRLFKAGDYQQALAVARQGIDTLGYLYHRRDALDDSDLTLLASDLGAKAGDIKTSAETTTDVLAGRLGDCEIKSQPRRRHRHRP